MTVSTTKNRIVFVGDSTTKIFSFDFKIIKAEHAKVYIVDNDIEELQILGTDYSMTGLNNDTGGAIEMMIAPASGVKLVIVRELLPVQETSLRNQGRFYPEVHEDAFDYEMMLIQQVANSVGSSDGSSRLLALGVSDTDGDGAYRAKGNRIMNVGDPINENDVTRLKDIKPFADQAEAAQQAAEGAQAAAEAAEALAQLAKEAAAESARLAAESAAAADPSGLMQDHLDAENPHTQYILTKTTIPTVHGADLIYVKPFGTMEWNELHGIYRSVNCCQLINGWNKNPAEHGCVKADGATYSKSGVYKGLWTAAQDYGLVVTPDKFAVGQYLFVDVGADAFRVPDTRGYFVRNTEATGRVDFSAQAHEMLAHKHTTTYTPFVAQGAAGGTNVFRYEGAGNVVNTSTVGGAETRPINTALPAWIRA